MSEEISFRNTIHKGSFRFDVTSSLWKALYEFGEDINARNVITVTKNGVLRGYAVYFTYVHGLRWFSILDMCADGETTAAELIDRLKERAKEEDADLIYFKKDVDPTDRVFDKKGFLSFVESIIMVSLLNPYELLQALSQEVEAGKNLRLVIKGHDPITIRVGQNGIKVLTNGGVDLTVTIDSETFLNLLFCRTSFWKEFLKRTINIRGIRRLSTASRFFSTIEQKRWYMPIGDWV